MNTSRSPKTALPSRSISTWVIVCLYCISYILSSLVLVPLPSYARLTIDENAGTHVVDFDANLGGVVALGATMDHDPSAGVVGLASGNLTGTIELADVNPAALRGWDTMDISMAVGDASGIEVLFHACGQPASASNILAGYYSFGSGNSVDISGIAQNCVRPVLHFSYASGDVLPLVDEISFSWNPEPQYLLSVQPDQTTVDACSPAVVDVAYSLSYVDDVSTVIYARLPYDSPASTYGQNRDTSFVSATRGGLYTAQGTMITTPSGKEIIVPPRSVYRHFPLLEAGNTGILSFTVNVPCNTQDYTNYVVEAHVDSEGADGVVDYAGFFAISSSGPSISKTTTDSIRIAGQHYFFEAYSSIVEYEVRVSNRSSANEAIFEPIVVDDLSNIAQTIATACTGASFADRVTLLTPGVFSSTAETITWDSSNALPSIFNIGQTAYLRYTIDYSNCSGTNGTAFTNTVSMEADNIDPVVDSHTIYALTDIEATAVFRKSTSGRGNSIAEYPYGERFNYSLGMSNVGLSRIDDIVIMDKIPDDIVIDSPIVLPSSLSGFVFYSSQRSGQAANTPPPYDSSGITSGSFGSGWSTTFDPQAEWVAVYVDCTSSFYFPHSDCSAPDAWSIPIRAYMPEPTGGQCDSTQRTNIANFTFESASNSIVNSDANMKTIASPSFITSPPVPTLFYPRTPQMDNVTTHMRGDQIVQADEDGLYTITVTNEGDEVSTNTFVDVSIPQFSKNGYMSYPTVQVTAAGGGLVSYTLPQGFSVDLGTMAIGEQRQISFRLDGFDGAIDADTFFIQAQITMTDAECGPQTMSVEQSVMLQGEPSLSSYKTRNLSYIEQGDEIEYMLYTINDGTTVSQDTYLVDTIPEGTEHVATYTSGASTTGIPFVCDGCSVYFAPDSPALPSNISANNPFDVQMIRSNFTPGNEVQPGVWESSIPNPHHVAIRIDNTVGVVPVGETRSVAMVVKDSSGSLGSIVSNRAAVLSSQNLQSVTNQVQTTILDNPGLVLDTVSNKDYVQACESYVWQMDYFSDAAGANTATTVQVSFPSGVVPQNITHTWNTPALSGGATPSSIAVLQTGTSYMTGSFDANGNYQLDIDINALRGSQLVGLEGGSFMFDVQAPCDAVSYTILDIEVLGYFANSQYAGSLQSQDPVFVQNPDLSITKNVSRLDPLPGEVVRYTLDIVNNGAREATGVEIYDTLPVGLCYQSGSTTVTPLGWSIGEPLVSPTVCSSASGNILSWTMSGGNTLQGMQGLGYMPGQSDRVYIAYDVLVDSNVPLGTTLINGASISTQDMDENLADNIDDQNIQTPLPDVSVQINTPQSAFPGTSFDYSVVYQNNARACASDAYVLHTIPDILPTGSNGLGDITIDGLSTTTGDIYIRTGANSSGMNPSFDPVSPSSGGWIAWNAAIHSSEPIQYVVVDYGSLCNTDGPQSLMISARAIDPQIGVDIPTGVRIPAVAEVFLNESDTDPSNNFAEDEIIVPGIDAAVQIQGDPNGVLPGTIPGATQNYLVAYTNAGLDPLCDVYIDVELSSGFVLNLASISGQSIVLTNDLGNTVAPIDINDNTIGQSLREIQSSLSGDVVRFDLGTNPSNTCLPPGASGEISLQGVIDADIADGVSIPVSVNIAERSPDIELFFPNNTDSDAVTVRRSDVMIHKRGDPIPLKNDGMVDVGDQIQYTVEYNNLGSTTAQDVRVREEVPVGTCLDIASLEDSLPVGSRVVYYNSDRFQISSLVSNSCYIRSFDVILGDLPGPANLVGETEGTFAGDFSDETVYINDELSLSEFTIEEVPVNAFNNRDYRNSYSSEMFEFNGNVYGVISSRTNAPNVLVQWDPVAREFNEVPVEGASDPGRTIGIDVAMINGVPFILFATYGGESYYWYRDASVSAFRQGFASGSLSNALAWDVEVIYESSETYAIFSTRDGDTTDGVAPPNEIWRWNTVLENFERISLPAGAHNADQNKISSISNAAGSFVAFSNNAGQCRPSGWPEVWRYDTSMGEFVVQNFQGSAPANSGPCSTSLIDIDGDAYLLFGLVGQENKLYRYDLSTQLFVEVALGQGLFPHRNGFNAASELRTADDGRRYWWVVNSFAGEANEIREWNPMTLTFDFVQDIGTSSQPSGDSPPYNELGGLTMTAPNLRNVTSRYEFHLFNSEHNTFSTRNHSFPLPSGEGTRFSLYPRGGELVGVANNYVNRFVGAVVSPTYAGTYRQTLHAQTSGFISWDVLTVDADIPAGDDVLITIYPTTAMTGTPLLGPVSVRQGQVDISSLGAQQGPLGLDITLQTDDITDAPVVKEWMASYRSTDNPFFTFVVDVNKADVESAGVDSIDNVISIDTVTPEIRTNNNQSETEHVLPVADLEVEMTVSRTAGQQGDILTYTIDYVNASPFQADNVRFSSVLPSYVSHMSSSGAPVTLSPGPMRFVGDIPAYGSGQLIITGSIDCTTSGDCPQPGDLLMASVDVSIDNLEDDMTNNSARSSTLIGDYADVYSYISCPPLGTLGGNMECAVVYGNQGNIDASGGVITIDLDPYVEYTDITGPDVSSCVYDDTRTWSGSQLLAGSHQIVCDGAEFATIGAGYSETLTLDIVLAGDAQLGVDPLSGSEGREFAMSSSITTQTSEVTTMNNNDNDSFSAQAASVSIVGTVYADILSDQSYQAGQDRPLPQVQVCIEGVTEVGGHTVGSAGDIIVACVNTDNSGNYAFTQLPPGEYTVSYLDSTPYDPSYSQAGYAGANQLGQGSLEGGSSSAQISSIILSAGQTTAFNNFGLEPSSCPSPIGLSISSPADGSQTNQSSVQIQGAVLDSSARIEVDGVVTPVQSDGSFQANVAMQSSARSITVVAYNGTDVCSETMSLTVLPGNSDTTSGGSSSGGGSSGGGGFFGLVSDNIETFTQADECPCGDYSGDESDGICVAPGEQASEYEDIYCPVPLESSHESAPDPEPTPSIPPSVPVDHPAMPTPVRYPDSGLPRTGPLL